jgi:hypothetical protein
MRHSVNDPFAGMIQIRFDGYDLSPAHRAPRATRDVTLSHATSLSIAAEAVMARFAPKARAICVTALPTDPPTAGASTVLPAWKTSEGESHLGGEIRDRDTCGAHVVDTLRYQAKPFLPYGKPLTVGSILKNAIRPSKHHP